MKDRLKSWLLNCPGFEALCRLLTRRHVRALMYHRFRGHANGNPRGIHRDTLIRQARYLARHHTPWTPDDHLQAATGSSWPGGVCPVVITVDDGYADFASVAHPVFRDHGLPAMLFVVTDFVEGDDWLWWDKLEYCFAASQATRLVRRQDGAEDRVFDLTTATGREAAWHDVADHCRFLPDRDKHDLIARTARDLAVDLPDRAPAGFEAVTWEQVRTMAAEGSLFGAHTRSHPILTRVPLEKAEQEIHGSQEHLAERLGTAVTWFAYPQGGPADWNLAVRSVVARSFRGSYLASPSLEKRPDPFCLPRYCIAPDMTEFRWKLCGAEYLGLRLRSLLGLSLEAGQGYWAGHEPTDPTESDQMRPAP